MIDVTFDTCLIIDLIRKQRSAESIVDRFTSPGVSHVVFGELLLGGMKSTFPQEKIGIFKALEGIPVLNGDASTAAIYARLRWWLEKEGTPIPQNDVWIAAASLQAGVPLVTRDTHFHRIPELTVVEY